MTIIVAVKVEKDTTTCLNTNATSGDATFSHTCPAGDTYSNTCSGNKIRRDPAGPHPVIAVPANIGAWPVTVNGGQVTADAGVSILFAAIHDGSCAGKFCTPVCRPTASFDVSGYGCSGAD